MPVSEISRISRSTKGVRIMRLKDDGKVVCVAVAAHEEEVEAEAENTPDIIDADTPAEQTPAVNEIAPGQSEDEDDEQ